MCSLADAVTYIVGTTDGSIVSVSCAQNFAVYAGDGYMQWGPVTNGYNSFTCLVQCKNAVQSCPVLICEAYTAGDVELASQQKKVVVDEAAEDAPEKVMETVKITKALK